MHFLIKNFTSLFIGLLLPGSSLLLSGRLKFAFIIPMSALLFFLLLGISRVIISPDGFALGILGVLLLHLLSMILGFYLLAIAPKSITIKTRLYSLILLFLTTFTMVATSHLYKSIIYGIEFYHIPSNSMKPALLTGDIILVDSWIQYSIRFPENLVKGDIIVFKHPHKPMILVKRILKKTHNKLDLRGDNAEMSHDSRYFGLVPPDNIQGKAQFILFSLNDKHRFFKML